MKRQWMTSIALMGLSASPLLAQDGVWKPSGEHRARYESVDGQPLQLIGRPITGKSRVDRALEPAGFSPDIKMTAPLPSAPATGKPLEYEALPFPRQQVVTYPNGTIPQGALPGNAVPMNGSPVVTYPGYPVAPNGAIAPVPAGTTIVNGQVVNGPIMGEPMTGNPYFGDAVNGMPVEGGFGGRYFQQAIHGSPGRWYGSLDFILFSLSLDNSPPLIITGNQAASTTPPFFSISNTRSVYGGDLPGDALLGGRVTMGAWFDRCQYFGMFGSFFSTATHNSTFTAGSADGSTFYGRPYFNSDPAVNSEQVERVSDLAGYGGFVTVDRSVLLRGADLNFRWNLFSNTSPSGRTFWHVDGYAGAKYMGLDESLNITEDLLMHSNVDGFDANGQRVTIFPQGTRIFVQDRFSTRNNFFGGNIGLMSEARLGRLFVEARSGIALGATNQEVTIGGNTQYTVAGVNPTPNQVGGLLAQQTNIGTYNRNSFSYVPEFSLKLGLQVTDHLRVYAGYDMMYWSNVVRPGQQIDRNVNGSQAPQVNPQTGEAIPGVLNGPARPEFNFNSTSLWINGFSAGLSWIF
ncbi:MAG: BBP7 family outer membrane beta-barrel protein [Gemmatales bacterium]